MRRHPRLQRRHVSFSFAFIIASLFGFHPHFCVMKIKVSPRTRLQGTKADSAVQPAALNNYVLKTGSWWTDKSIVPDTGNLLGGGWTFSYGVGLSSSWIVRNTSRGYEFRGWSNCAANSSSALAVGDNLSQQVYCWCKTSDPFFGSSWAYRFKYDTASGCAECAAGCAHCMLLGENVLCSRPMLLK
jgi:hypothetical protein